MSDWVSELAKEKVCVCVCVCVCKQTLIFSFEGPQIF